MSTMRPKSRQHGFGLVAAMFVIIIITAVITAMARLAETQNATNSMAIQQARAYQAARAGLEWGIYEATHGGLSCVPDPAPFVLADFTVKVTCTGPTSVDIPEENKTKATNTAANFYELKAIAEFGGAGNPDYAYRQLTALVEP